MNAGGAVAKFHGLESARLGFRPSGDREFCKSDKKETVIQAKKDRYKTVTVFIILIFVFRYLLPLRICAQSRIAACVGTPTRKIYHKLK